MITREILMHWLNSTKRFLQQVFAVGCYLLCTASSSAFALEGFLPMRQSQCVLQVAPWGPSFRVHLIPLHSVTMLTVSGNLAGFYDSQGSNQILCTVTPTIIHCWSWNRLPLSLRKCTTSGLPRHAMSLTGKL